MPQAVVVVDWKPILAEARSEVRRGDLSDFLGGGESSPVELFGVLDRGDVGRSRLSSCSEATLER